MIFEQIYGKILEDAINLKLSEYNLKCRRYDEVAFKPLAKNPDEVALIINGGGASRSSVVGQNQSSGTISIVLLCQKAYMDIVRVVIDEYQKEYNAKLISTKGADGTDVLFRSVFTTPIVLDAQDLPTNEHGTLKTALMQFTVTVIYGDNAGVSPSEFTLLIYQEGKLDEAKLLEISNLLSYERLSQPVFDIFLGQGKDVNTQISVSRGNSIALTIFKVKNDNALQKILNNELKGIENGLFGNKLGLYVDSTEEWIPIQAYQLTESYVDGTAVYVLTLML